MNSNSASNTTRPVVFMDINIGETPAGRLKMELFSDIVPKYDPLWARRCQSLKVFLIPLGRRRTLGSYAQESTGKVSPLPVFYGQPTRI